MRPVALLLLGPLASCCLAFQMGANGANSVAPSPLYASSGEMGVSEAPSFAVPAESADGTETPSLSRRKLLAGAAAVLGTSIAGTAQAAAPPPSEKKPKPRLGGMPNTIRSVGQIMDELQRDLMQEKWELVEAYPAQLRSFVPVFTKFTDSAFPTEDPTDKGLRVALRYEVGRFFASVERLRQATSRKALDEAYVAYSDMSLHFDRYMQVGGLYTYYDDIITTEKYFKGIKPSSLVYSDPRKDPPEVRDLVILTKGPDMGRTGILIGIYPDGKNEVAVKLDRFKGMRPIRVVPKAWVAKRLGEQDPDDVFLIPRKNASANVAKQDKTGRV